MHNHCGECRTYQQLILRQLLVIKAALVTKKIKEREKSFVYNTN